ncbi:16S rRNA processing protein [Aliarcobacter faecis]|uniref:ribosome maturation factor RimM n=1 Tax=Aliarcobacter faecis TaxID=1564138 RepID=UPI00047B98DD|nr:ribosome maturation factor RimM [Aliarcobacter faecis]QKF72570.1 16S rRNA processing protein [Aliarcobacter faecis]
MNKVYVAKLGKAVGLQGHLRLFIDSDFPEQFKKGAVFTTNRNLALKVLEYNSNKELIRFEEYLDVDLARKLTNSELFTTQEATKEYCKLKENEFFWFDLISCEIFENDLKLGTVKDIHRYPLNDYLEVQTTPELIAKNLPKIFLIPHIFDSFIEKIEIENKKIFVKNAFDILENS